MAYRLKNIIAFKKIRKLTQRKQLTTKIALATKVCGNDSEG